MDPILGLACIFFLSTIWEWWTICFLTKESEPLTERLIDDLFAEVSSLFLFPSVFRLRIGCCFGVGFLALLVFFSGQVAMLSLLFLMDFISGAAHIGYQHSVMRAKGNYV